MPAGTEASLGLLLWRSSATWRAMMQPFKQRQYWDIPPWTLSKTMERAINYVDLLISAKPKRRLYVDRDPRPSLVLASDAQVEPGRWPGGGVLLFDPVT